MTAKLSLQNVAIALGIVGTVVAVGCGGTATGSAATPPEQDAGVITTPADSGAHNDAAVATPDAGHVSSPDASSAPDPLDGTPVRESCTHGYGTGLDATYGRIDGYLAALQCGSDATHIHLQIKMNGAMYDAAVNLDTLVAEKDGPMPDSPWTEGWHVNVTVDYPTTFGLHSSDFTQPASQNDLVTKIENELANANHISLYATGYGTNGVHDVHRHPKGNDGVIVIRPTEKTAHMLMFRFSTDATF
jgi:hypothetical protein